MSADGPTENSPPNSRAPIEADAADPMPTDVTPKSSQGIQRIGRFAPFHSADFPPYLLGERSEQTRQSLAYPLSPQEQLGSQGAGRRRGLDDDIRSLVGATARSLRVLILAGIPTGAIVIGLGSRLAMFALRLTSSANVDGVKSDDGFIIGRFTLSGTYNLMMLGAAVGVIGAAAYLWVRPWLIGPVWFRYLTLALAAGAVVGSMLVHADGIDFTLLDPLWFAVALFVVLPAIFAVSVAWAVEYVKRREVPAGSRRWILPVVLPLMFPFSVFVVAIAALITSAWMAVRQSIDVATIARKPEVAFVMRGAWLGIAVLGLFALMGDISDLRQIN